MKIGICDDCKLIVPACILKCRKCQGRLRIAKVRHPAFTNEAERLVVALCDSKDATKGKLQQRISGGISTLRLDQLMRAFEGKGYIKRHLGNGGKSVRFSASPDLIKIAERMIVASMGDRIAGLFEEIRDPKMLEAINGIPDLETFGTAVMPAEMPEVDVEPPMPTTSVGDILGMMKS